MQVRAPKFLEQNVSNPSATQIDSSPPKLSEASIETSDEPAPRTTIMDEETNLNGTARGKMTSCINPR